MIRTVLEAIVLDLDILQLVARPTFPCSFICSRNFLSQDFATESSLRRPTFYSQPHFIFSSLVKFNCPYTNTLPHLISLLFFALLSILSALHSKALFVHEPQ